MIPIHHIADKTERHADSDATLVSIILPTHNGATRGFLQSAINSVLAQTHSHWELIVANDGSTDKTSSILSACGDARIHTIEQPHAGVASALHTGINHSQGAFACFLGDDDRWLPVKLERQIEFFQNCERQSEDPVGLISGPMLLIDAHDRPVGFQHFSAKGDVYERLFTSNLINSPSVMMRRDMLIAVGSIDPTLSAVEDLDLWLRIAHDYPVFTMDEVLVEYRMHGHKMSADLELMYHERRRVIERALDRNRRTDVSLDRQRILFNMEKLYFEKCLEINDTAGTRRHFANAARLDPLRVLTDFKMPVKRALTGLGLGRTFARTPIAE